jgi:hypothetical protein
MNKTVSGVSLALGLLGGCTAAGPAEPVEITGSNAQESQVDLERLRALQVFHVGQLVLELPAEATACYGLPCPGWEDRVAREVATQMPRLDRLTAKAEALRASVHVDFAYADLDTAQVERDLQTLRDLHIIQVGALVAAEPVAEPNCYNLPCPGEVERENLTRAAIVHELAAAAGELDE